MTIEQQYLLEDEKAYLNCVPPGSTMFTLLSRLAALRKESEEDKERLRGVSVSNSLEPLVCFKCGTPKNPAVYHYCHACMQRAELAEASLRQAQERERNLHEKWYATPISCKATMLDEYPELHNAIIAIVAPPHSLSDER